MPDVIVSQQEQRKQQAMQDRKRLADYLKDGACDLHLHTTHSDGADTPEQLVDRVLSAGLKTFAITDHDCLSAIDLARKCLDRKQAIAPHQPLPRLIPGVELSVDLGQQELHLLGYFFQGAEKLATFLDKQITLRKKRNRQMIQRLQELGYAISQAEYESVGEGSAGRLQAAILLVKHGYVSDVQEAFAAILGEGLPGFVARPHPTVQEAIEQVHQAGGLAVLAHPALYGWCSGTPLVSRRLLFELTGLKSAGLDGVEAWHGESTLAEQAEINAAGQVLDLLLTAGSDDHGTNKDQALLYGRDSRWPVRQEILVVGALRSRTQSGRTRYLVCRRRSPGRHAGLWELPGGKVEPGESAAEALQRELKEELDVTAKIGPVHTVLWHDYPCERVNLAVFDAQFATGQLAEQAHDRFLFATPEEALELPLLPADVLLFKHLRSPD